MNPKLAPILFGLLLSCFMTCIVSGIATLRVVGFASELPGLWFTSWMFSWVVAFPAVLVLAPMVRRFVASLVRNEGAE